MRKNVRLRSKIVRCEALSAYEKSSVASALSAYEGWWMCDDDLGTRHVREERERKRLWPLSLRAADELVGEKIDETS